MTDQESKALYIAQQAVAAGMTLAGAAGLIANMEAESVLSPINLQDCYNRSSGMTDAQYTAAVDNGSYRNFGNDAYGYGLCQWTAQDRKKRMLTYFQQRHKSIGDFQTQVEFALYEMKSFYASVWKICCSSNSAFNCGYNICCRFEIPANTEAQGQTRGGIANRWFSWLENNMDAEPDVPDDPQPTPEPTPEPAADHSLNLRTIDYHCSGWDEVYIMQGLLKRRNYHIVYCDGQWDDEEEDAVRQFQKDFGLTADGIVGQLTWKKLQGWG